MKALIVLDTARKDYGEWVIRRAGLRLWENVISTSTWTGAAHASMFSGMYPSQHGVRLKEGKLLPDSIRVRARTRKRFFWKESNMKVLALSANFIVSNWMGYGFTKHIDFSRIQGIPHKARFVTDEEFSWLKTLPEHYQSKVKEAMKLLKMGKIGLMVRSTLTVLLGNLYMLAFKIKNPDWPLDMGGRAILNYLENTDKKEIGRYDVLFINLMEFHEPYSVPDRRSRWRKLYEKEAEYEAKILKKLVKRLTELEITSIFVTSDHGQLLGEHGLYSHTHFPYEELTMVPFGSTDDEPDGEGWISLRDIHRLMTEESIERKETEYAEFCGIWPHGPIEPRHYIAVADKDTYGVVDAKEMRTVYGEADTNKAKHFLRTLKLTQISRIVGNARTHF